MFFHWVLCWTQQLLPDNTFSVRCQRSVLILDLNNANFLLTHVLSFQGSLFCSHYVSCCGCIGPHLLGWTTFLMILENPCVHCSFHWCVDMHIVWVQYYSNIWIASQFLPILCSLCLHIMCFSPIWTGTTRVQCCTRSHSAQSRGWGDQSSVQGGIRTWRGWSRAEWTGPRCSASSCGGSRGGRGWRDDLEIRSQACHYAVCPCDALHGGCRGNH